MIHLVRRKGFYIKIIFVKIAWFRGKMFKNENIKTLIPIRYLKGGTRWMNT